MDIFKIRQMVTETPTGKRFCVVLLDKVSHEAEANDETHSSELFEIGWVKPYVVLEFLTNVQMANF